MDREDAEVLLDGKPRCPNSHEAKFYIEKYYTHLVLHIQCQSFCWQIMVKVPETVNAHYLPMSCQETRLSRLTCSGILRTFGAVFIYSEQSSLFGSIFPGCFQPRAPRCSAEPWWWCVFESSSHWTPMVTSQSIGVLDLQRLDDCVISNIVNLHGGGVVGICETTRYCFSSFEFGTP